MVRGVKMNSYDDFLIFKILYFSISVSIFLAVCAPNFKRLRNGRSIFSNLLEMYRDGVPGSLWAIISFVNLIISVLIFFFRLEY